MIIEVTSTKPEISQQDNPEHGEGAAETVIKNAEGQVRIHVRISDEYRYILTFLEDGNVRFTSLGRTPHMVVPQNLYLSQG